MLSSFKSIGEKQLIEILFPQLRRNSVHMVKQKQQIRMVILMIGNEFRFSFDSCQINIETSIPLLILIILDKYINNMSGKSKKTTIPKEKGSGQLEVQDNICLTSEKQLKKLSASFYGEDTMKQQKQIILDTYEDYSTESNIRRHRYQSNPIKKNVKCKTPTTRIKMGEYCHNQQNMYRPYERQKKIIGVDEEKKRSSLIKKFERSLSRGGSRNGSKGKNVKVDLLKYMNDRIDGNAKGWKTIKAILGQKNKK